MDFKNNFPIQPLKFEVGQILLESRDDINLVWEILSVGRFYQWLKLIHGDVSEYNSYKVGDVAQVGVIPETLGGGVWTVASLSRTEVKIGQIWYNRNCGSLRTVVGDSGTRVTLRVTNGITTTLISKSSLLHYDWHLISDPVLEQDSGKWNTVNIDTLNLKDPKGEKNKMFMNTHKVSEITLKPIDQETIDSAAHEIAALFGFLVHVKKDGTTIFRKPGKLTGAIVATPETVERLFREKIVGNLDLTVLDAAANFGIVERVIFTEAKDG